MSSKDDPYEYLRRLMSYLREMPRKTRLRVIDHTLILISSIALIQVSIGTWQDMATTATDQGLMFLPQIHFLYTIFVILIAIIACEFTIRYLVR